MDILTNKYPGWIVVSIKRHTAWQIHNFMSLVDSMFTQIKESYEAEKGRILFDLSELSYFDSTVVSLILRAVRLTGDEKNSLLVSDEKTRDILGLLGITRLVDVYDSETDWAREHGLEPGS
jgi:anti-anti-sigma regulatory factor